MRSLLRALATVALSAGLVAVPAAVSPSAAFAGPTTDYVALGDSYSSGTGTNSYDLDISCQRSSRAYPALWAAQRGTASFTFAACAGATTSSVRSGQLGALNAGTDLVTITVGGNDADFVGTVLTCKLGSDATCFSKLDSVNAFVTGTLPGRLDAIYADIKARAPNARLVVLGYPQLFQVNGINCLFEVGNAKRSRINATADLLSSVTAQRVAAAGGTYLDARSTYAGHGICSWSPYLNGTTFPVGDSYHPNRNGYSLGYLPLLLGAAA
ncbi:MAG: putative secreted hydrolase [uncultured Corynebacteriales bacterium]|uniref:Putative secreted hydrolase n=1 Tax=uncultured Mycobacteriales bacterium TaxID=581187 RepID=A0A6J4JX57_9ACTN|nr:MAG: putative secreted hydrolase [uncultured Corynebacteriales bacterium]